MTKTDFIDAIKSLQDFNRYMEPYEKVLKDDGPWNRLFDKNIGLIADVLSEKFDVPDKFREIYSDVIYFVYDLNFGKEFKMGMVIDPDGSFPDFSTAEKLYDYFEAEYAKGE